jgi:hypothetical protein
MSLLKIRQFSIDQTDTFSFANANITGNLNTGNANLGNLAIANFFSGNGNALYSIQGANVTGQVGNALVAGTVYTAAQGNITSVGTLTGLAVSNATGTVNFTGTGNVTLGAVANLHITGGSSGQALTTDGSGTLTWSSTGNANIAGSNTQLFFNDNNSSTLGASANLTFDKTSNTLTVTKISANGAGLSSITGANVTGEVGYAATANAVAGGNVSGAVAYATTANSVAGGNVSGQVGNALVAGTVYGATQSNITSVGTLTGLVVGNSTANSTFGNGTITLTSAGNINAGNLLTTNNLSVTTYVTSDLIPNANVTYNLGNATNRWKDLYLSDSTIYLGTGTISPGTLSSGNSNVSIPTANGNVNISAIGNANVVVITGTGVNVAGTLNTGTGVISGNGSGLTSLTGANVTGEVGYAATANAVAGGNVSGAVAYATTANAVAGGNVSGQVGNALVAGTVYSSAQPNITSVGTLTSLAVSGDSTITGNLTVTGSFEYANVTTFRVKDPIIEQGGNVEGGALSTNDGYDRGQLLHYYSGGNPVDAFMGWDNSNAEFAFASNASIASEVATFNTYGNLRAGYFLGNGSQLTGVSASTSYKLTNGTSNVDIPTTNGNVVIGIGGTASVVTITTTGVNIAGYANLGTGNLTTTGNVTAGYVIGNGSALSSITGANVTGEVNYANVANNVAGGNVSGQVGNALVAGTVYSSAQPNITSTGSLTGLTVSNATGIVNFTTTANVTLGSVSNLHISGGGPDYYLKTDGSGSLSWSALPSTTISVDTYTGDGSWTMKTLSSTPLNINYTIVAIGGVFQPRDAYDVTGAVITFDDPPPNGAIVEITIINGGTAGSAGYVYQGINSSTTAIAGVRYLIDTSSAVTLTLPASASLGDEVGIIDATGGASTNNITIARNGGKIEGASSNMVVSTDRSAFTLVYYNSTQGWVKTQK